MKILSHHCYIKILKRFYLLNSRNSLSSTSSVNKFDKNDVKLIRNIGIIAHIDAGKTTTTERMLYYSGFTNEMGEVHDGDTIMDYMSQERERGITITSASITFPWKRHQINLVDTPGHVDFTIEVERSLSVLDGAIAILDGSAGVEAQTMTVWRQADHHQVPRIIYLNKMDKPLASISMCLDSIKSKLKVKPLLINLPLIRRENKKFTGIIDVISLEKLSWEIENLKSDGREFQVSQLTHDESELFERAVKFREELIGSMAELDDQFANDIINCDKIENITNNQINNCLRRITIKRLGYPVLIGSSYKNIGVQFLLDSIIKYLPCPAEMIRGITMNYGNELCAFAFKTIHHKLLGQLTFIRIYSGEINNKQTIYNLNCGKSERITKLYTAFADEFKEVPSVGYGNIAVVSGLEGTITGDTLTSSQKILKSKTKSEQLLAGINIPEPVFFCSIEAPSISKQRGLELALNNLQKEDPTFKVETDPDSGQLVIKGMGELHIEVIKDRILKEYGIESYLGKLQISYKETIIKSSQDTVTIEKTIAGTKNFVKITLLVKPDENHDSKKRTKVKVALTDENEVKWFRSDHLKTIESGVSLAMNNGPILSYPVIGVSVELLQFQIGKGTTNAMISAAASQCLLNAIKSTSPILLEPYMRLEIQVKDSHVGTVLSDLSVRRSSILGIQERGEFRVINAITPLSELINYSTNLRTITSGNSNFTMEFDSYKMMNENQQKKLIQIN